MVLSVFGADRSEKIAQILRLAQKITEHFYEEKIILAEENAVVQYGLENLIYNLLGFGVVALIGGCFGHLISSIFLWMFVFPLRKYAGGFHARTRLKCIMVSIGMLLFSFAIFYSQEWSVMHYIVISVVLFEVIFVLAPIDNPNKLLDYTEYRVYRMRTRSTLVVEKGLFVIAVVLKWENLYMAIIMSFFIVAVSLVAGKISNSNIL